MTQPIDDATREALRAEARRYIAERLRENIALFEADLLAILRRHGDAADPVADKPHFEEP